MTQQLTLDDARQERDAVLALIADDPRNEADVVAVAETILTAARADPDGRVSANDVRDQLDQTVRPGCIGSTFHKLKQLGVLAATGEWTPSTDRRSRNADKPTRVWRLTSDATRMINGDSA